jgi:hypothetical protein
MISYQYRPPVRRPYPQPEAKHPTDRRAQDVDWRVEDTASASVEMALRELSEKQVVGSTTSARPRCEQSDDRTCAESEVQPVINTGTLYN